MAHAIKFDLTVLKIWEENHEKACYFKTCEDHMKVKFYYPYKSLLDQSQTHYCMCLPRAGLPLQWELLSCISKTWWPSMLCYLEVSTELLVRLLQSSLLMEPTLVSSLTNLITINYGDPLLNDIHQVVIFHLRF